MRIEELRVLKRYSQRGLADAAGISNNYLRMIVSGVNPSTKQKVRPSAGVLWQISEALGDGDDAEARDIYNELMELTGYPGRTADTREDTGAIPMKLIRLARDHPALKSVQFHRMLEHWTEYTPEELDALARFFEWYEAEVESDSNPTP